MRDYLKERKIKWVEDPSNQCLDFQRVKVRKFLPKLEEAIGISEETDAIAIIVSEETGRISIAINGNLNYNLSLEEAKMMILDELKPKKTAEFDYEVEEVEGEDNE